MRERGPITPLQRELYELILALYEHRGDYPSQRYLAQFLGVTLKTVQDRLAALYVRGWLSSPTPAGVGSRRSSFTTTPDGPSI